MASATQNTAKQMKLITHANRDHSGVAGRLLDQLRDIRQVSDRNAREVKETKGGAADLLRHAQELTGIVERSDERASTNGRSGANGKRKASNGRG
jgi:methyl-accepting chemotaxis protein